MELRRLRDWYKQGAPNEFIAWAARNVYELKLLLDYILESEQNVQSLINQPLKDHKEILEGMVGLYNQTETEELKASIKEFETLLGALPEAEDVPKNAYTLAKISGAIEYHNTFYKMFSKYVHPSPWLLFGPEEVINSDNIKRGLVYTAQNNAFFILKTVVEKLAKDE